MMFLWICLFTVVNSIMAQDSYLESGEESVERFLTRSAMLDRRYFLQWGTGDQQDIVFKLEVETLGYVALGFNRKASLINADVVVGWVSNNKVYLQDRYAEGYRMSDLDDRQDWELISGYENSTHTTLVIRRKLDTCDLQDFALEYENTVRLMYAYSFDDPIDKFTVPFDSSIKKGWRSFLLLQPLIPKETEVEFWDVLTADFSVSPEWHTMYWCKMFRSPNLTQKHHITTVDTVILGGNRGHYVHHIIIFECVGATPEEFDPEVEAEGYNCLSPKDPVVARRCDGIFAAWGMGADSLVLPDHVGMPLEANRPKYYMLNVHYDNFDRHTGTPGRAGFRFHYTPRLRQYDAGLLRIGEENEPNIMVPPLVRNFKVAGHSNPDCFGPALPEEGVVIGPLIGLHTHLLGTMIKMRHFRGNKELPPIVFNKHYDPDYQQYHNLRKEVLFLPQDQMTIECNYDSSNKSTLTFGGLSTREEMCNAFVLYYPMVAGRYGSMSQAPQKTTARAIGSQELISLKPGKRDYDSSFIKFMLSYDWKETAIRRYEKIMKTAKKRTICFLGTGDMYTVKSFISYPSELQEYTETKTCKGLQDLETK